MSHDWKDNDGDFVINYAEQKSAFVEDLYQINGDNQPPATKISVKFAAVTNHIENANASANKTQLFVSFASGFGAGAGDTLTPKVSPSSVECLQGHMPTLKRSGFGGRRRNKQCNRNK